MGSFNGFFDYFYGLKYFMLSPEGKNTRLCDCSNDFCLSGRPMHTLKDASQPTFW